MFILFVIISQLVICGGAKDAATKFATSGADGRVVIWDVKVRSYLKEILIYFYYDLL